MSTRIFLTVLLTVLVTTSMAQHRLLKATFNCRAAQGSTYELLQELVSYCGINIEFSPSVLDNTQQLTLTGGKTTIGAALTVILKGQRVSVIEKHDKIIIASAADPLPPGALLEKHTLFGFIQQEGSLEPLPFATIREQVTGIACESNIAGFYSLDLPAGKHMIEVSFSGCNTRSVEVDMQNNTRFNLILTPTLLPQVQVNTANVLKRDAGNKLDKEQTGMYSNMLGETDPIRAVYLLPGNMETQETGGKLIVRGGEPGQSLFLLDGNLVFNPAHLLGEIAVVNNTSVKSVRQYKNDFPARYGGAVSSITSIQTKDGNMEHWHGEAEGGISSGAVTVEGPLTKNRTALMISGRSSLGNALNPDLSFYDATFGDFHVKLTHQFNRNNKLLISAYTGNDRMQLSQSQNDYLQKWSNALFTINWNLVTGKRSFVNTALNISSFDNYVALKYQVVNTFTWPVYKSTVFNNYSSGKRYEAKTTFELTASPYLQFLFGGSYEHVAIAPYTTLVSTDFEEDFYMRYPAMPEPSFDNLSLWYENEIRVGNNWLFRPGLYANAYSMQTYNHQSLQPRLFASYRLDNKQQLNFSYSHTGQVLHEITSPYTGINREIWFPANGNFQPVLGRMINLGYQYKNSRVINFSADMYYKTMEHVVNFSENANVLFYNDAIEKKFITGTGKNYGVELVAERKFNKWKTLLSYTLSWSWRRFDSIQNGQWQPYRYDRRHNINWLLSFQLKPSYEISLLWHFHTGDWITIPSAIPSNPDENMNANSAFKPYRTQVFNRININTTWYLKPWKRFSQKLNAGVHIMDQSPDEYNTKFSTTDNNDYNISLFPNQLFKYSWYIAYNISF